MKKKIIKNVFLCCMLFLCLKVYADEKIEACITQFDEISDSLMQFESIYMFSGDGRANILFTNGLLGEFFDRTDTYAVMASCSGVVQENSFEIDVIQIQNKILKGHHSIVSTSKWNYGETLVLSMFKMEDGKLTFLKRKEKNRKIIIKNDNTFIIYR